jgi:hypothetical protein
MSILSREFIDDKLIENPLDILEVRYVTACADDGVCTDRVETGYIFEAGERTI